MPRSLAREWSHSTRGLRLAGFGTLAELGHQSGEGVLGRWPGRWHVLLHGSKQTISAPAVFLDETVPASHSARQFPHVGGLSGCWNTMADSRLCPLQQPPGLLEGLAAIKKLASAAKVTEQRAKDWLKRQAIWQIYLPAPRRVQRPKFDVAVPNEVHQADLLFMPHDRVGRKTFRYALTVVDVASRYNEAEPLTSKTAAEVADALSRIYRLGPLKWPKLL